MKKNCNKKIIKIVCILFSFILIGLMGYVIYRKQDFKTINKFNLSINRSDSIDYNLYYNDYVKTINDKKIYILDNNEFKESGIVYKDVNLNLSKDDNLEKGYYKIKDSEYYIDYKDIEKSEEFINDSFYKNYIPFNESIKTKNETNLYLNDIKIYTFNESMELPIIIKENDYYGVVYKDNLYYVKKEECEVIEHNNTEIKHTDEIAVLTYHFVYDHENLEEKKKCINMNSTICISDLEFEKHLNYIKENRFYTATMKDLEMFVDKKIQLPEHTVVLTIDDGNFVDASIKMLEKYDLHATLFLIGIAGSPDEYKSNNLEIHSHTWNMHNGGKCQGGQGSEIKCLPKEEILEDLKKSRESLNNTTYFCWPFFEYNDYAINILKEAGFTMGFVGGRKKVTIKSNKIILPRYGIVNTTNVNDIAKIIN